MKTKEVAPTFNLFCDKTPSINEETHFLLSSPANIPNHSRQRKVSRTGRLLEITKLLASIYHEPGSADKLSAGPKVSSPCSSHCYPNGLFSLLAQHQKGHIARKRCNPWSPVLKPQGESLLAPISFRSTSSVL